MKAPVKLNKIAPFIILLIGGLFYLLFNNDGSHTVEPKNDMPLNNTINETIIGFYNVENLFDIYDDPRTNDEDFTPDGYQNWNQERYDDKLEKIAEMISTMHKDLLPAVMGFSEIENHTVLQDLLANKRLKDAGYKIIHKDNHDGRGIDVAAIYRPEFFKVDSYTFTPVTLPGMDRPNTRDILEIKGTFSNGKKATIYFTHWSSRRAGTFETEPKRIATAKIMRSKIDAVLEVDPEANIFILGDFNDEPSDKSVKEYLMKNDFANLSRQFEHSDYGTVNHQGDWLVFDQVIVSNSAMRNATFKLTEKSAHIHKTESNTFTHKDGNQVPSRTYGGNKYYGGYSDHYPVYLKLNL
ncbi:MAG: endonuclease [Putridiphycobacter sp.]|nr:endonuclease [Putridiphycobacter sp.]